MLYIGNQTICVHAVTCIKGYRCQFNPRGEAKKMMIKFWRSFDIRNSVCNEHPSCFEDNGEEFYVPISLEEFDDILSN